MTRYFVVGGAGFIGSHLTRRLLADEREARVTVYDNFSSGREWHLGDALGSPRVAVVRGDVKELDKLTDAMRGHDHAYHFASNPDIAKAVTQPDIDFWEGTYLTQNVVEAMRRAGVRRLTYASGSGVYGDTGTTPAHEDYAPLLPISTYGASKLAGEALIGSYCHMFGLAAAAFRFANVVGPHQTHGVGYDFVRRLTKDPSTLHILGDGQQSKSYVYVEDVIAAMRFVAGRNVLGFEYFNVATEDYVTVQQIADIACERLGITGCRYTFAGGDRGWKGDVPVVRFDSSKLRKLGWRNQRTARQALTDSIDSMVADAREGKFDAAR
ncbi:MAG TPA: NAD-dependent epimerase/dehydratase family protein [Tepidisphaeraceae bacterium]|nr:NAD-dependent epimerase/dehydratase family protein [Tepidisphaeraceae bacterium]